jgi:hypothetical protein
MKSFLNSLTYLDNSLDGIERPKQDLGSLAQVELQNQRALNVLTGHAGGTHILCNATECLYKNISHKVEENLKIK